MGRTHHLKQTLLQNIHDSTGPGAPDVEFVVVDYNSRDGLKEWILTEPELQPFLESDVLKYARYPEATSFHHAHAKNMAHRLATGDFLCNLDADNFLGYGFASRLAQNFGRDSDALVLPDLSLTRHTPVEERGFYGRIAMSAKNFLKLGGYDEDRRGWGGEDTDLILRALSSGMKADPFSEKSFMQVVGHTHAERVANLRHEDVTTAVKRIEDSRAPPTLATRLVNLGMTFGTLARTQKNRDGHIGAGMVELGCGEIRHAIGAVRIGPAPPSHAVTGYVRYKVLNLAGVGV